MALSSCIKPQPSYPLPFSTAIQPDPKTPCMSGQFRCRDSSYENQAQSRRSNSPGSVVCRWSERTVKIVGLAPFFPSGPYEIDEIVEKYIHHSVMPADPLGDPCHLAFGLVS